MSMNVKFNKNKESGLGLEDIDTGCYVAKHLSAKVHNRLVFIRKYADNDVIMVFDKSGECTATYDNIPSVFQIYSDWKEVDITVEVD